jgi:CheY-like chemotaxis protein
VFGDPGRLRQILTNLIGNAIKFTEKGEVLIRVNLDEESNTSATVRFSVSDTGIGIPKDRMDRLFKSFPEVDATATPKHGDTGLGLTISKQLAELMGGQIGVESEYAKGATFWFTAILEKHPEGGKGEIKDHSQSPRIEKSLPPLRILLAEDNKMNQEVTVKMLMNMGHSVVVANNGKEAVEAFESSCMSGDMGDDSHSHETFDLMLMNVQMPVMDGIEATKAIRNLEKPFAKGQSQRESSIKRIPIIALTAHAMKGAREEFLAAGMDGYISKPTKNKVLAEVMAKCLWGAEELEPETRPPRQGVKWTNRGIEY